MTDRLVAGLHCSDVGDLAAGFVLGALEPSEMAAVRAHLAGCPEAHAEVAELGSATSALLAAVPEVEPPAALRDRILAAARAEQNDMTAADAIATDTMAIERSRGPERAERARVAEPAPPRADRFGWLPFGRPVWAAAAVAAVVAIAVLGAQTLRIQQERDAVAAYQRGVAAVLELASQRDSQFAVLSTDSGTSGPAGIAAVGSDGTVKIAMSGLSPTTGSQVYEAWLVTSSGAQPIGGFPVGSTGSGSLTTSGTASTGVVVALTLEPNSGATTPTLPIVAKGAAQPHPAQGG